MAAMSCTHRLLGSGHFGPAIVVQGRDLCRWGLRKHPQAIRMPGQHDLRPEQGRYGDQRDPGAPTVAEKAEH